MGEVCTDKVEAQTVVNQDKTHLWLFLKPFLQLSCTPVKLN